MSLRDKVSDVRRLLDEIGERQSQLTQIVADARFANKSQALHDALEDHERSALYRHAGMTLIPLREKLST